MLSKFFILLHHACFPQQICRSKHKALHKTKDNALKIKSKQTG